MWNWTEALAELARAGTPCVLATLTGGGGSTPAPVGAKLILAADGRQWGTVGGGALEAAVLERAQAVMGGTLESLRLPLAAQGQCCGGMVELLLEPLFAGPRLHVLGAGHVARELALILTGTRLRLELVDARPEWIRREGLPAGVHCHEQDPLAYVRQLQPDPRRDLVLILTYSHELDLALLRDLLTMPIAWLGLIGSRHKWSSFRATLLREGLPADALERVCCPVGDSRAGKAPREVAIAMAQHLLVAEALLARTGTWPSTDAAAGEAS
jgi:xanthine dehydrogenase accessory factor